MAIKLTFSFKNNCFILLKYLWVGEKIDEKRLQVKRNDNIRKKVQKDVFTCVMGLNSLLCPAPIRWWALTPTSENFSFSVIHWERAYALCRVFVKIIPRADPSVLEYCSIMVFLNLMSFSFSCSGFWASFFNFFLFPLRNNSFISFFNSSILDLQCSVSFRYTAKYTEIYIHF